MHQDGGQQSASSEQTGGGGGQPGVPTARWLQAQRGRSQKITVSY
jgi:hypothetical protein